MKIKLQTYVIIIITLINALGCSYRNTSHMKRYNCCSFTIKPNTNSEVYKIIDTTKLYKKISTRYIPDDTNFKSIYISFLKFYANGKVGTFYNYGDKSSLNPSKADMGYYNYSNNKLTIQTYFDHPQGGGFLKREVKKLTQDTIEIRSGDVSSKYIILEIPKEYLIYKPDWR